MEQIPAKPVRSRRRAWLNAARRILFCTAMGAYGVWCWQAREFAFQASSICPGEQHPTRDSYLRCYTLESNGQAALAWLALALLPLAVLATWLLARRVIGLSSRAGD